MNPDFFKEIYHHPQLLDEEYVDLIAAHKKIEVTKGELLLRQGKIAQEYYLIESGLFRSYIFDFQGEEVTVNFFTEREILIEVSSLFQRIPSQEYLQALTAGTLWKIDFEIFQELYHKIPKFNEWGRAWMANQLFTCQQRSVEMRSLSAKQRYLKLVKENPLVVKHAPLKYIASFLGITDSSLSRIRKEISAY